MVTRRSAAGKTESRLERRFLYRTGGGNTLVLIVAITLGVLVALFIFALNFTRIIGGSQEHTTAIEAAALAAARDLSRIIVEDPNLGFISLSDYPPIGSATKAGDGQPLPVYSINTVMGTARLDTLIANALDDETMKELARRDVEQARQAAQLLTQTLEASLQPGGSATYQDVYGNPVTPYDNAKQAYQANQVKMAGGGQLVEGSFKLALGWLNGGSTTVTAVPQPADMAAVPFNAQQDGNYRAYLNIPANGVDFYFAGVNSVPTLRDPRQFVPDDGVRIPAAVKVEADHTITEYNSSGEPRLTTVHNVACAEPAAIDDHGAPGTLSIGFPSGPPPGITTVGDLTSDPQLQINKTTLLTPPDGDYPTDSPVLMPASFISPQPSISQIWSSGLYHWIKNARTKPNIKDLKNLQQTSFSAMGPPGNGPQSVARLDLIAPVYADDASGGSGNIQTGILSVQPGGPADQRIQSFLQGTPEAANAYTHMASYDSPQDILPSNSLMVSVTADGQVMSADGKTALNTPLIHSFWARMAESNAAGLAALAMGTEVARLAQQQIDSITAQAGQLQNTVGQLNTQLQSGLLSADQATQARSQAALLSNQIAQLNGTLAQQKQYLKAGQNAVKNGTMVASVSDSIIQNQRTLTAKGLSQSGPTFVLAGVQLVPHPVPPSSLDAIRQAKAPSGDTAPTDWTAASGFYFYTMPALKTAQRPAAGSLIPSARAQSVIPPVTSKLYLFEFDDQGHVDYTVLPASPFVNVVASQKQNLAVSVNAMTTAASMPVVWSMAFRDECAKLGRKSGGKHAGQPIGGSPFDWCESTTYGDKRKEKKGKEGKEGKEEGYNFDLALPVYADPNGNVNNGNAPWKQAIRNQARQTYLCGGLATEMQILNPIVTNCGFPQGSAQTLATTRATTLTGVKSPGTAASLNAFGLSLPIPASTGLVLRDQPGPVGPGTTLAPGSSVPTSECPAAPPDLL